MALAAIDLHNMLKLPDAQFATLDGRLPANAVRGGSDALTVIV